MKIEKSVAGVWNRWIRDNMHLVKYNLGDSYPAPQLSLKNVLDCYSDGEPLLRELALSPLDYGPHTGPEGLREEICKFYPNAVPKNIVLAHGASAANDIVIRSLYEPGVNCICIAPAYQQLLSLPKALNYGYREVLLSYQNSFKLNFKELSSKIDKKTKLIILGNPNNPAGAACSEKELKTIIEIVESVGAYILCDEIYTTFEYDVKMPTIFGMYDKAIVTNSLSKAFGFPGLRVGWIVANKELAEEFATVRDISGLSIGWLDEKISLLALQKHEELNRIYLKNVRKNWELLDEWVNRNPHLSYVRPDGGTVAIVKFDFNMSSTDFCQRLVLEYGVNLLPGISFNLDDAFRIGFTIETNDLIKGCEEIDKFCKKLEEQT